MEKGPFDRKSNLRPKSNGQLGWPRREHSYMGDMYEYHTSSGSSSWSRLFGEFTILPRINSWSLWNSYSKWLKNWSRIREKSEIWPRLIKRTLRGAQQVYYVTKPMRLRKPKPTSSPIRCSVQEAWKMTRPKLGRTTLNGNWWIIIWKIWIASMESGWSSSGRYSQDSQGWASSKRFKHLWQNYSVSLSSSPTGSSSCQCTTTLYGENKETQKNVRKQLVTFTNYARKILARLLVILGTWIRKENGTEPSWTNQTGVGQNCWTNDAQLCRKRSSDISIHQCPWKVGIKKQSKGKEVCSLQRLRRKHWTDSAHDHFCKSAQC